VSREEGEGGGGNEMGDGVRTGGMGISIDRI